MSDECNCIIDPDEGRDDTVCNTESDNGNLCGKPEGHDGPHAACDIQTHPVEVWRGESA